MRRFVFDFSDSDFENKGWKHPPTVFFFDFANAENIRFDEGTPEGDDVVDFATKLEGESFGVHDWSTCCNAEKDYYEVVGYCSYEVQQHRWNELIMRWHEFFKERGFGPGAIQSLHRRDYYTEYYPWATYKEEDKDA